MEPKRIRLKEPKQFQAALRLQQINGQLGISKERMAPLTRQMQALNDEQNELMSQMRGIMEETFRIQGTPIQIDSETLEITVLPDDQASSPISSGKLTPSGNNNQSGTGPPAQNLSVPRIRPTGKPSD